jgi:hypothetical protein
MSLFIPLKFTYKRQRGRKKQLHNLRLWPVQKKKEKKRKEKDTKT